MHRIIPAFPTFVVIFSRPRFSPLLRLVRFDQSARQDLVSELKLVENTVVRLQLENRCMERVLMNRGGS